MSKPTVEFIDSSASGKPDSVAASDGTGGNPVTIGKPEPVDFGFEAIDPQTSRIDTGTGADGIPRTKSGKPDGRFKRGRAAGTETGEAPKVSATLKEQKISLESLLFNLHVTLAVFTKIDELTLDQAEAKEFADAIAEVGRHYAVTFDPKKVAIFNLAITAGKIYGTRIMAYRMRKDSEGPKEVIDIKTRAPEQPPAPKQRVNGAATVNPHLETPGQLWQQSGEDTFNG